MNYREWYVGMRVVYVGDGAWKDVFGNPNADMSHFNVFPERGKIYTIREISIHRGIVGIKLMEIVYPVLELYSGGYGETAFDAREFKPVDETKLDQFRKHLVKRPKTVSA